MSIPYTLDSQYYKQCEIVTSERYSGKVHLWQMTRSVFCTRILVDSYSVTGRTEGNR